MLLLSDAGKEGLDLKETSQVHVLEPQWNDEKVEQVIGRAVRFKSHARFGGHVEVFRYVSVLPMNAHELVPRGGTPNGFYVSTADQVLYERSLGKIGINTPFLGKIIEIAKRNVIDCLAQTNYQLAEYDVPDEDRRARSEPPTRPPAPGPPRRTVSR